MFKRLSFAKPKGPGFGIGRHVYMTVLAAKAPLPAIECVVHPKGENGAHFGFGVPLCESASKALLSQPMERGTYAIASVDRKTVLRCLVVSKEEAGFTPESFVQSAEALGLDDELIARMRATWTLVQLSFESFDPEVAPSLQFLLDVLRRIGELTDGSIADPIARRYWLPEDLHATGNPHPIPAPMHVSIQWGAGPEGLFAHTLGLQKFGLPEFELFEIRDDDQRCAERFLMGVAQTCLNGRIPNVGDRFGALRAPFEVCPGGLDRGRWEGIACYELVPPRNRTTADALDAWSLEEAPA